MNQTTEMVVRKGLKARDIAAIGIFGAILYLVTMLGSAIIGLFPTIYPYAPTLIAIMAGPIFMLITAKVHKTGAVMLSCTISAILFLVMGALLIFATLLIAGVLGELLVSRSGYKSFKMLSIAYMFYIVAYYISSIGPMYYNIESYISNGSDLFNQEYIDALLSAAYSPLAYAAVPAAIAASFLGAWIGRKLTRKHFEKAGIV